MRPVSPCVVSQTTPPIPTLPSFCELAVVIMIPCGFDGWTVPARSTSADAGIRFAHGRKANAPMTSIRSVEALATTEAMPCIGERYRLLALFLSAASGCACGSVRRSTQSLVAACLCRSSIVGMLASASATAGATKSGGWGGVCCGCRGRLPPTPTNGHKWPSMIAMQTIGIVRNWPRSLVTFHYRFSREDGRGDRGDCPLPAKLGPYGHPS